MGTPNETGQAEPGFIQFGAFDANGVPTALCPGIKSDACNPSPVCRGGVNTFSCGNFIEDGCFGLGGKSVYLAESGGQGRRMTRCPNCQDVIRSHVPARYRNAVILADRSSSDPRQVWTLVPFGGKCLIRADNNMYAVRCSGCLQGRKDSRAANWGVWVRKNHHSLWEVKRVKGDTYTFKLADHDRYLSKCHNCAEMGHTHVYAYSTGGESAEWDVTVINEDQYGSATETSDANSSILIFTREDQVGN